MSFNVIIKIKLTLFNNFKSLNYLYSLFTLFIGNEMHLRIFSWIAGMIINFAFVRLKKYLKYFGMFQSVLVFHCQTNESEQFSIDALIGFPVFFERAGLY